MGSEIIDYEDEQFRDAPFFGRTDVLEKLRLLLTGDRTPGRGWVLLKGSPGIGKTAIVHQFLDMLPEGTPYHFIRSGYRGSDRPAVIVQNLCAGIENLFPQRANPELPVEARLGDLLRRVAKHQLVPGDQRLILVIDGLDEVVGAEASQNPLPSFLPSDLPRGVVILCASRPMHPHLEWLMQLGARCIDLDQSEWQDSNEAAVRAFWEHHAGLFMPPLEEAFIEEAVRRAGGNQLHAILLREWIEEQPVERRAATNIPRGLDGFLMQIWARLHAPNETDHELVVRGLGIACAAREALAGHHFGELLGGSTSVSEAFLQATRPFLREEHAPWLQGRPAYRPYHEYFRAFIVGRIGPRLLRGFNRLLADTLAAWPVEDGDPFRRAYALRHAVAHRLEAGDIDEAYRLCVDVGYLDAKCRELSVAAIERDFEAVIRARGGDASLDLSAILAAVSAESSQLCAYPGSLPALLYNRLRCAGWSHVRIARLLHFDAEPPPLRLFHGVRLGPTRLRAFLGHDKLVSACVVTPDGGHVLSASADRSLRLWSLRSGDCVKILKGHDDDLTSCALTPDGKIAVSTSNDTTTRIWDLAAERCLDTLDNGNRWATTCALAPEGRHLVIGSDDGTLTVWDLPSRQRIATWSGHDHYVTACLVTPSGKLVSASRDQSVRVWDLETGECIHTLRVIEAAPSRAARRTEDQGWINALALLPDGWHVLAAAGDGSLYRWDLVSGECVQHLGAGQGRVDACVILHDGRHVLCGLADGTAAVWDLAREQRVLGFRAHEGAVAAFAATADGQRILSGSHDRTLRLWELGGPESLGLQDGHDAAVTACAMTPDGRIAVSASEDGTLKIWDVETGACHRTLSIYADVVTACAISADGRRVLLGGQNGSVRVWDVDSDHLQDAAGHRDPVSGCVVLPDGRMITSSRAADGVLLLRDSSDITCTTELAVHGASVDSLATTTDGTRALSVSRSGMAYVWDVASRCSIRALFSPASPRCGALTPDGQHVVLARQDGKLEFIEIQSRRVVRVIQGHTKCVFGCAVSADSVRVIAASEDGTVRVFSLETGRCLATLPLACGFRCIAVATGRICVGDEQGNLWMITDDTGKPARGGLLTREEVTRLRDALARLYVTSEAAQRFAHDVGLDATRLHWMGRGWEIWNSICAEAEKQRRVEELLLRALKEYPRDPELIELERQLSLRRRR
ncbi:effector-associated domain EAD1-containing protein [Polyangium mundeleinium]|uniref:Effector-associated domain EAD1-containing protein n=1 Tax=Polyangium mundeleinium TaxID=2995306 RepID=A0ABT5EVB5_9BACT|nr:effector-associated domain EAD1-containing protein [Polyangium mundeleinium]MDC0744852.1 effector-associated domain EAD1-containing protein [Polyangium mundeleinium]